ncbi:MAG: DNA methyltransferase [Candidatus Yanofskybacteria bacterium RIFCSPLOWO2_12_FULL_44_13b]|nr:MAG: DNA methyltransferase [Candidatus Yanofskybacteria bacterium RIFCSPHIGHO2_01_FULL_44_110b]OGN15165.1 MAG: DNA methyltransferase [Candidatus Yanofskybacteria bacterium RIFCSPHIGHO2_02_FULL_44_36b]OGN18442.1 MAG: DNA methyltransferase [Candidatus Yanofskybacteria bacterium RIFCSPHIGHO2_12_FULL_44_29b]OGN26593.1 MAG: DNA methyltransferase [Candidatus Yanofskybacteria bacterium RIFCSPLOWO2_01_FULL_44_88]OGN35018.1 MAG: DNA methyltransferase [Candidatus Yanofskybacteria bacterium RIFCSPLOWO2
MQKTLFNEKDFSDIKTQGIKYAGSKLKIIPYILEVIKGLEVKTVLDGFSGSTRVSQAFAQAGYDVTSNDIAHWSEVCAKCFLLHNKDRQYYQKILDELNSLKGYDGWFTAHYGGDENMERKMPFQIKNTRKLDAIRDRIEELNLNDIDGSVVLTSLLFALDAVDSTLGHFASYLSRWSKRSYNDLFLKLPDLKSTNGKHKVTREDIFKVVDNNNFDLAYFDPPYGSNNEKMPPSRVRYSAYYHIWTSVVNNDKPKLFGKVNRREDTRDLISASVFEEYRKNEDGNFIAMEAIRQLIQKTKAKYILLSYSSGGRATKKELEASLNEAGKILKMVEIDYKKNIMASMSWTNEWLNSNDAHKEYLFLMKKTLPKERSINKNKSISQELAKEVRTPIVAI